MKRNLNSASGKFKKTALVAAASLLMLSVSGCKDDSAQVDYSADIDSKKPKVSTTPVIKNESVGQIESDININKTEVKSDKEIDISTEKNPFETQEKSDHSSIEKDNNTQVSSGEITTELRNIYVVDGDTIYGENKDGNQVKIRMTGIDAPESDQLLGDVSKLSLQDCVDQTSDIKVVVQANNQTDKYGRTLGKVMAGDTDCNLWQVGSGMAWFYSMYSSQLGKGDAKLYEKAEKSAKEMRAGIWMEDMIPAWEYRKNKGS